MVDKFDLDNSFELDGFVNYLNVFYDFFNKGTKTSDTDEKYRINLCCGTAVLAIMMAFCNRFPDLYEIKYEKENNKIVKIKIEEKEIS